MLFNGKDLSGWDGDPRLWSVKDGVIRGETTAENPTKSNTFLVYRGGQFDDFELNLKFRLLGGNSGVQYRSKEFDKWRIAGYQADILEDLNLVGFLYHEGGRGFLVDPRRFHGRQRRRVKRRSSATSTTRRPWPRPASTKRRTGTSS